MKKLADRQSFNALEYILFAVITVVVIALCTCLGSFSVPLRDVAASIASAVFGTPAPEGAAYSVTVLSRLPRVLCVGLGGAALSLAGAAMQGLLKNPLADGSTLGVSAGASLGAVIAIAFGSFLPSFFGTAGKAMLFAFLQPTKTLKKLQDTQDFTQLQVLQEELKLYPLGDVWTEYCKKFGLAADESWLDDVRKYEQNVFAKRG